MVMVRSSAKSVLGVVKLPLVSKTKVAVGAATPAVGVNVIGAVVDGAVAATVQVRAAASLVKVRVNGMALPRES